MRSGFGRMFVPDTNEEYIGEWQDNEKTGTGEFKAPTLSGSGVFKGGKIVKKFSSDELALDRCLRIYQNQLNGTESQFLYHTLVDEMTYEQSVELMKQHLARVEYLCNKQIDGKEKEKEKEKERNKERKKEREREKGGFPHVCI
jgi:hypothetical protein